MGKKKCKVGLDISSIGYFVAMDKNHIISVCQVPQKVNVLGFEKQIANLKPLLKEKGMKTKVQKQIVELSNQILNSSRGIKRVVEWLENLQQFFKSILH